jgi:hypothetical protein
LKNNQRESKTAHVEQGCIFAQYASGRAQPLGAIPRTTHHMQHRKYARLKALDAQLMRVSTAGLAVFADRLRARIGLPPT